MQLVYSSSMSLVVLGCNTAPSPLLLCLASTAQVPKCFNIRCQSSNIHCQCCSHLSPEPEVIKCERSINVVAISRFSDNILIASHDLFATLWPAAADDNNTRASPETRVCQTQKNLLDSPRNTSLSSQRTPLWAFSSVGICRLCSSRTIRSRLDHLSRSPLDFPSLYLFFLHASVFSLRESTDLLSPRLHKNTHTHRQRPKYSV